jgi:hypothetical protein
LHIRPPVGIEIDQITIIRYAARAEKRRQALVVRAGNAIEHLIDDTVDAEPRPLGGTRDDDRILCATGRPLMPPIMSACGRIADLTRTFPDFRLVAVILHRMWIEGTEFNWSKMEIAA